MENSNCIVIEKNTLEPRDEKEEEKERERKGGKKGKRWRRGLIPCYHPPHSWSKLHPCLSMSSLMDLVASTHPSLAASLMTAE